MEMLCLGKDGGGNNISAPSLLASGFIRTRGDRKSQWQRSISRRPQGPLRDSFLNRMMAIPPVEIRAKVTVALPGVCENLPDKALNLIPSNFCEEENIIPQPPIIILAMSL